MEPIRSSHNPKIIEAGRLQMAKERRRSGLTLIEGPKLVGEAAAAGIDIIRVFGLPDDSASRGLVEDAHYDWIPVETPILKRLASTETPRGPVAVIRIPDPRAPKTDLLWIESSDPGNAGTLVRSAAAFGLDVAFSPRAVDPWSPKVVRAGAGGHFHTRLGIQEPPEGWGLIAAIPRGGLTPRQLFAALDTDRPWAVLIGDEASGLDTELVAASRFHVTIPMPGGSTESLNAGVAGSILAYELSLWRDKVGHPFLSH